MSKTVELNVLADRSGRILATAQPVAADKDAPALLGFRAGDGQRSFVVEVPAEKVAEEGFLARLASDFRIDLEAPAKARLEQVRSR